jgi:hypothetical protein
MYIIKSNVYYSLDISLVFSFPSTEYLLRIAHPVGSILSHPRFESPLYDSGDIRIAFEEEDFRSIIADFRSRDIVFEVKKCNWAVNAGMSAPGSANKTFISQLTQVNPGMGTGADPPSSTNFKCLGRGSDGTLDE